MKIVFTFSRNPNWFSRATATVTDSQWSHCLFVHDGRITDDKTDDPIVSESTWNKGVNLDFWSTYKQMKYEAYVFHEGDDFDGYDFYRKRSKTFYAYGQAISAVLTYFLGQRISYRVQTWINSHLKKIGIKKNLFEFGEWCSEYCWNALMEIEHLKPLFEHLSPHKVTPEDLYRIIKENSGPEKPFSFAEKS